ncbi:hypothetical protein PFISCL1PPCAC_28359, partial [Pristionchus fissidentatus]
RYYESIDQFALSVMPDVIEKRVWDEIKCKFWEEKQGRADTAKKVKVVVTRGEDRTLFRLRTSSLLCTLSHRIWKYLLNCPGVQPLGASLISSRTWKRSTNRSTSKYLIRVKWRASSILSNSRGTRWRSVSSSAIPISFSLSPQFTDHLPMLLLLV